MWGWIIDRLFGWRLVGDSHVEPMGERRTEAERKYGLYQETDDVVSMQSIPFCPRLADKDDAEPGEAVEAAVMAIKIREEDYHLETDPRPRFPQVLLNSRHADGQWYEVASIDARELRGQWYVLRRPLLLHRGSMIDAYYATKDGEQSPQSPKLQLKVVRRIYCGQVPTPMREGS